MSVYTRALRLAMVVAAAALAGCAAVPSAPVAIPDDDEEPVLLNRPAGQPMVEYPPIEPVEPPEVIEPPPSATPAPTIIAPPTSPAAVPPPAAPPLAAPAAPGLATVTASIPELPTEDQQMNALLADLNRYGALSADDIKREIVIATQALTRQRTDHNRIRLAVLYTLARTAPDDQRALQLFENVLKGSASNGVAVKTLAAVLQLQVAERVRAVRDEQRKGEVAVQKLEALREMERSLLRDRIRSGGGGGGTGGGGGGSAGH